MKINERALVSFASDSTSSDKADFLHKKEVNKGFQKRFFVLRGNMLSYYEKNQDKEPVGVIVLENFHVIQTKIALYCLVSCFRIAEICLFHSHVFL